MAEFRHEYKFPVNEWDCALLRRRLPLMMQRDEHSGGCYRIRSLYFDDPYDKALYEKLDGVAQREKFRIRLYNGNGNFIRLEKKIKRNGLCAKAMAPVSRQECESLIKGDYEVLRSREDALVQEFYRKLTQELLRPKTLVDYQREAFVYPAGNVRITLDTDIRTGVSATDLFEPGLALVKAEEGRLLEVKFDEFLPEHIRAAMALRSRRSGAFSKYAACRRFL